MRAIAELLVDSTICLPADVPVLTFRHPSGRFKVHLRNNSGADPFARDALRVEMEFEVESMDHARDQALDNMAVVLNSLCRVTGAKIDNMKVLKAFDATPGLEQRDGRYYSTQYASLSIPDLNSEYGKTVERMMAMHDDEVSQSIMRWYRLGRRADNPEEQFMYLWFALEIAAEALKEAGKIGIPCPRCHSDLHCPKCGETPTRRRVSSEAIRDLIVSVAPAVENPEEYYKVLSKIRNTLQHGRRFHTIAEKIPCTEEQALTAMANIAWRAMTCLANQELDEEWDKPLVLVRIEDVQNKTMVLTTTVKTSFARGDNNKPTIADAPDAEITLHIAGREFTFDGKEIKRSSTQGIEPPR